jgi:uncharacterized protein (TIGR00255 family)
MDLSARIAPLYREKEMEIRNEISKMLERGKVDFSLWIEKKDAEQLATPINQELVEAYYKRIKEISAAAGIPEPADWFATLLRMPDVMTKNETQELSDEEWAVVHAAVEEAINHLIDFRKQEGAALEKKFREKIENIARLLESVAPYEQERVGKVKERITDALEKTLSVDYDKNRLEQELIYYIEKLDINEEKQRLSNHLKYFISTLAVELLDIATAHYVYIEYNILSGSQLLFHLCFQCSVEAVLIHFLVFQELIVGYAAPELIGSEKEILHPVLLRTARRTAGCRNRESQIQVLRQQIVDNCGLARPGGSGKYNQFTHLWYLLFNGLLFNPLIGLL